MASRFPFLRIAFTLAVAAGFAAGLRADPIISEFMASNSKTYPDSDGNFYDWIELYNPAATPAELAGWYLTDDAVNKAKWKFPSVTIPAGGYLVVFASGKDKNDPAKPLHTNFSL